VVRDRLRDGVFGPGDRKRVTGLFGGFVVAAADIAAQGRLQV
jgi:hypothetical protein